MNLLQRLGNHSYLDAQQFTFDKSGSLLVNKDDLELNSDGTKKSLADVNSILTNVKRVPDDHHAKKTKKQDLEDKLHELKDTSELIEEAFVRVIEPCADSTITTGYEGNLKKANANPMTVPEFNAKKTNVNPITVPEFNEIATRVFQLFRNSIVKLYSYR